MGKFQFGKFVGILMVFATYVSQTRANTSVVIEAVDDYSYYTGNHLSDTDAIEEATPFWNQMGSSNLWTQNTFWQNSDVWDVDFYDPDLTGSSSDDGDAYLDMPGGAISWAIGHGMCDDVTTTTCTTDADCASVGGYCPKFGPVPANSSKVCIKQLNRKFVTSSSTTNSHGNVAYYGQLPLSKSLAIGEDYYSGGFDGAGTNGGMNVFMLTNSCGLRPPYWVQDLSYIFAGMQLMMMNVPVAAWKTNGATNSNFSDTSQWSARGSTLVSSILANDWAPASSAWNNPTFVSNSYSGAGANLVFTANYYPDNLGWYLLNEPWNYTRYDSMDTQGNTYLGYYYMCNYDCSTYGLF